MTNAIMKPPYQATRVRANSLPRRWVGANSASIGKPTAYSMPTARPINRRTAKSCSGPSTKNCKAEKAVNSARSQNRIGLRPNLSASHPPKGEPMRMPNIAEAASSPIQTVVNRGSSSMVCVTGPMLPRM